MLHLIPIDHQLIAHDTHSQGSSAGSDHASTSVHQGSTGTRCPALDQAPRRVEDGFENKGDRMKTDLLGIGSQFEIRK